MSDDNKMIAHCLFEQSGTFKNEFKKLGVQAFDYDILNEYGETDYICDLFAEIDRAYAGGASLFDEISPDDLVLAFFPCTRFEDQALLLFRGDMWQFKNYTAAQKLEYDLKIHEELAVNYATVTKLALIAIKKGLRLMIENPFTEQHYLRRYWSMKPAIIDRDRTQNGDHFRKPTQYYFIGFKPKNNLVFEMMDYNETKIVAKITKTEEKNRAAMRSEIAPQYASRFIRQYLIDT